MFLGTTKPLPPTGGRQHGFILSRGRRLRQEATFVWGEGAPSIAGTYGERAPQHRRRQRQRTGSCSAAAVAAVAAAAAADITRFGFFFMLSFPPALARAHEHHRPPPHNE